MFRFRSDAQRRIVAMNRDAIPGRMSTDLTESYDAVPYVADGCHEADPAVFGAAALLRGIDPPPVETARILDLGCAVGGISLGLAARYPNARIEGIDLSPVQIAAAQGMAKQLGLSNAAYRTGDLTTLTADDGPFDYVFAHGVYSWVPDDVRAVVLERIRDVLAPGGVAYVSYNALPGGYRRLTLRRLMRMRAAMPGSREMVEFAAQLASEGPHQLGLQQAALRLREEPDAYLAHDHLEPFHHPVWYRDFAEHAGQSGLLALCDAVVHSETLRHVPDEAMDLLGRWVDDVDSAEVLDVLRDRAFRQTVLVHGGATPGEVDLSRLHVWSALRETRDGRFSDGTATVSPRDGGLRTLMASCAQAWPGTVAVSSLPAGAVDALPRALANGAVLARLAPVHAGRAGGRPTVFPFARALAKTSERVVNLRNETVVLPDAVRKEVPRLAGHRDARHPSVMPFLEANALLMEST